MNQQQIDVINLVQEVLRAVVISTCAINRDAMPAIAKALSASASNPGASPMAAKMLADLAAGMEMLESAKVRKQ